MNPNLKNVYLLVAITNLLSIPVLAKDSYQLNRDAENVQAKAADKEMNAAERQAQSSAAIDQGDRHDAAKHAKQAAKEQDVANKYEKKADDIQYKADKKALDGK